MKLCVLGAGTMGSLYGGRLAAALPDWSVTLVDIWAEHVAAINQRGLIIESDDGETVVRAAAASSAEGLPVMDLVLVFTKTLHTEAALNAAKNILGPQTWLMSLQNGLGNIERLEKFVPRERLIVGTTNFPSDLKGPGRIHQTGTGETKIRLATGAESPFVADLARAMTRAGLNTHDAPEVLATIWEKAAFNAVFNSLCGLSGCPVGAVNAHPCGRELAMDIIEECLMVGRAHGIAMDRERLLASLEMALTQHTHHKPSMLQDLMAGRKTEIEAINGAFYHLARDKGLSAPINGVLYRLVRFIEDSADWKVR